MGDEGRLYVSEDIVPAYKTLLRDADLILPNCFEAELLSDMNITDMKSLTEAITTLHLTYQVPNILVTSLRINPQSKKRRKSNETDTLAVVGSTCRKGCLLSFFQFMLLTVYDYQTSVHVYFLSLYPRSTSSSLVQAICLLR